MVPFFFGYVGLSNLVVTKWLESLRLIHPKMWLWGVLRKLFEDSCSIDKFGGW